MKKVILLSLAVCLFATACEDLDNDKIALSKNTVEAHFESAEYVIKVSAPCSWEAISKNEWISLTCDNGIAGTEELRFVCDKNLDESERKGTIVIKNEDFGLATELYITQKSFVPELIVDDSTISFEAKGGSGFIKVASNFGYSVGYNSSIMNYCWAEEGGVKFYLKSSDSFESRTTKITIYSEKYNLSYTVDVLQAGWDRNTPNRIEYTSSRDKIYPSIPYGSDDVDVFGANIVIHTFENKQGVIIFDSPVTKIGYEAFRYIDRLTSITIPNSVSLIGTYAFEDCNGLINITIPDGVTSIEDYAFQDCTALTSVTTPNSVTSIGERAFYNCTLLTSITIPDSVTSIGDHAFAGCSNLASATIGNGVTEIESYTFFGCNNLESVIIGNSVASIGYRAFEYCRSLSNITIGDGVTYIGASAFEDCESLTSITIPNSVTLIMDRTFYNCSSLKSVYCKPITPPTGYSNMFDLNASGRKIYVPLNSVEDYKSTECWSRYANYIVGYDF